MLMAPVRVAHGNQVLLLIGAVRYIAQCFCCWGIDRVTSLPASLIALRLNYDRSSLAARPGRAGLASARAGYCALYRDVVILLYVYTCLDCVVCCKKNNLRDGFPVYGESGNVREFCSDWNVRRNFAVCRGVVLLLVKHY